MNVAELSLQNLEKFGVHEAFYFQGRWYTNREMLERSLKIARGLAALGVERGDRVATVLGNCPEVLNTFTACFRMGAWCMPVMFSLTGEEMGYIFADAAPKVVITQSLFLDKVRAGLKQAPSIATVVTIDPEPIPGAAHLPAWLRELPADFPLVACDPDDVALLMYTSGTTGAPKGVMLSHDNLYFDAVASANARSIQPGETFVSCLPLNHSYGIILWASSECFGIKNALLPRFDPDELLGLIQDLKASAVSLVPTMLLRLLNHPNADAYDLSSMRRWGSAAAPLPAETRVAFQSKFPGMLIEAYGLTECSPTVTISRMEMPSKAGSVGTALEGVTVAIQDEAGRTLPPNRVGEICVRGRNVMKGYYRRPELTGQMIRDGWLHTGDTGYLDADGYLFITDRIKDLIIRGGENIFPKDIEDVLLTHPQVAEVAVIGMPDADYGEVVMAVIVPPPGESPSASDLLEFSRAHLAKFQVPQRIEFVSALPKNAIGKLLKRELRKQYFPK